MTHDWQIEFYPTGHRGLCRGCGRTIFTPAHLDGLEVGGECVPVTTTHAWTFGVTAPGRAFAGCIACGKVRNALAFDGKTRYPPLDLTGDCPAVAVPA